MKAGLEGQTDGEATNKKKRETGERKRLPFRSPDEKERVCGEQEITERMEERKKRRDVISG